jgi:hypothetical protein
MMDAITAAHDGDIHDRQHFRSRPSTGRDGKKGIEIIVSVVPEADLRPKSTRSSMGKVFRSDRA